MNRIEAYSEERLHFAVNHFTENFTIHVNERPTGRKVRHEGGLRPDTYLVERLPYTKLVRTMNNAQEVYALSNKGLWLFIYILFNLERGRDYVQINPEHYKKKIGISADNTLRDAKKELIAKGFIAPTGIYKTVYWINPRIFFPGSRIAAFPGKLIINPYKP